jgi:hypothetical protein
MMGRLENMERHHVQCSSFFCTELLINLEILTFFIVFFMSIQAICSEVSCPEAPVYCRAREKSSSLTGYLSEPDQSSMAEVSSMLNIY